jgi:hypothetical protein
VRGDVRWPAASQGRRGSNHPYGWPLAHEAIIASV